MSINVELKWVKSEQYDSYYLHMDVLGTLGSILLAVVEHPEDDNGFDETKWNAFTSDLEDTCNDSDLVGVYDSLDEAKHACETVLFVDKTFK